MWNDMTNEEKKERIRRRVRAKVDGALFRPVDKIGANGVVYVPDVALCVPLRAVFAAGRAGHPVVQIVSFEHRVPEAGVERVEIAALHHFAEQNATATSVGFTEQHLVGDTEYFLLDPHERCRDMKQSHRAQQR